jgi:uncharacterized protein (DUF2141 family)
MSRNHLRFVALAAAAATLLVPASNAAKPSSSAPTLSVTFQLASASSSGSSMPYGTPFVVSGCGYGSAYTSVVARSPEALSFAGQSPSGGCVSFSNFSTNAPGQYQVDAYQDVHGHSSLVASTKFTVS